MDKSRRKELAQAWKERPRAMGVFAVRCAPTGETWVSASRNLDKQENSLWFALDLGSHPNKALQAAYTAHGRAGFSYEPVAVLDIEGLAEIEIAGRLKDLEREWRGALEARAVVG